MLNKFATAVIEASLEAASHYVNAMLCKEFVLKCDDKDGKNIYRRGVLRHKTMALIAYDRSITGRIVHSH